MKIKNLICFIFFVVLLTSKSVADLVQDVQTAFNAKNYTKVLHLVRPALVKQDPYAQRVMGILYDIGQGVPQDYVEAAKWYRKAAMQEDFVAQNNLGNLYRNGKGVTQDFTEAIKWFRKAANQGYDRAQTNLGSLYQNGEGVTQNYTEATKWYRKAAAQGNAYAQDGLGWQYQYGQGVTQDYAEAMKWYRKAATQGDAYAQYNLGALYDNGQGVLQDYVEAAKWYRKAADQEYSDAQFQLGYLYDMGQGVTQDYGEAAEWYRKAAEQGVVDAQTNLGHLYKDGQGVTQDYTEAANWFRKAAEQGEANAQDNLAVLYRDGEGVTQDFTEAVKWYRKAAEQGIDDAQNGLGWLYQNGHGVPQDYTEAVKWYRKAAEQGGDYAQNNLGLLYQNGQGVVQDNVEAYKWYALAAAHGNKDAQTNMEHLSSYMTREEIAEAKRRAITLSEGKSETKQTVSAPEHESTSSTQMVSSQTSSTLDEDKIRRMMREELRMVTESKEAQAKKELHENIQSDVDKPKYKSAENSDNYAVVVGIENYTNLPEAQFAERDAQAVREHLVALGYPERHVILLTGQQATRTGLAKYLEAWLPQNVNERSTVFFYYSGHGTPDIKTGQACLVPADGDPQYLDLSAYPVKQLYEKLNALKAKRIIVALDSCFSGAGGRSVLAKGTKPLVTKVEMGAVGEGKIVSLSASEADQISGTIEDQGHGAFTYYLLKGLNGAATDKNGGVTVKSLYDYIVPNVQDAARRSNRDQTPQLMPASSNGPVSIKLR